MQKVPSSHYSPSANSKEREKFAHSRRLSHIPARKSCARRPTTADNSSAVVVRPDSIRERLDPREKLANTLAKTYERILRPASGPRIRAAASQRKKTLSRQSTQPLAKKSTQLSCPAEQHADQESTSWTLVLNNAGAEFAEHVAPVDDEKVEGKQAGKAANSFDLSNAEAGHVLSVKQRQQRPKADFSQSLLPSPSSQPRRSDAVLHIGSSMNAAEATDGESFVKMAWAESKGPHHAHPRIVDIRRRELDEELTTHTWATRHLRRPLAQRPASARTAQGTQKSASWLSSMARYESFAQMAVLGGSKLHQISRLPAAASNLKASKPRGTPSVESRSYLHHRLGKKDYAISGLSHKHTAASVEFGFPERPASSRSAHTVSRLIPYKTDSPPSCAARTQGTAYWTGTVRHSELRQDYYVGPSSDGGDSTSRMRKAAQRMRRHFELVRDEARKRSEESTPFPEQ